MLLSDSGGREDAVHGKHLRYYVQRLRALAELRETHPANAEVKEWAAADRTLSDHT